MSAPQYCKGDQGTDKKMAGNTEDKAFLIILSTIVK